jgi:hypothetical protein
MFDCLVRRLGPTWKRFLKVWLPLLLVVLGTLVIQSLYTGDWTRIQGALATWLGIAAVTLIAMIIGDVILCAAELTDSPPSGSSQSNVFTGSDAPSTGTVDCPTAQASLAIAKAQEATAKAALDDAAAQVGKAQDLVNASQTALTLALTAVALAALFAPWAVIAAISMAVAAGLNLWVFAKVLNKAIAEMNQAAFDYGAAQAAVRAAEAMVAKACTIAVTPIPPGPGITVNALAALGGLHGARS